MLQFLTPLFWLAALGIGVPLLIHLVRRERSPRFAFSSLRFLRPVTRRSIRYLKIRNPWLLLLRALLVLLLVAAFARPYLSRPDAPAAGVSASTSTVVLLDNSYSMVAGGGFPLAAREARNRLSGLNAQDEAALVTFADTPSVVAPFSPPGPVLQRLFETAVLPTYRTTDYVAALRLADKMLGERVGARRIIYLITDLQRTGFRAEDQFKLSPGVVLELKQIVAQEQLPVHVTGVALEIGGTSAKPEAKISVRVVRRNQATAGGRLALLLNGVAKASQELAFENDVTKVTEQSVSDWPSGNVRGEVQAGKSSFYFVSGGKPKEQVLVVEGPAPLRTRRNPAYYLMRALAAGSADWFNLTSATPAQAAELPLQNFRVIFLVGTEGLSPALQSRLLSAVREGAGLVIAPGIGISVDQFNTTYGPFTPAVMASRIGREREPSGVLGNIRSRHPIFKIFTETGAGNFLASRFQAYFAVNPVEGGQVLARFDDGNPALVERAVGRGRVLLFTSSMDGSWSDLPLNPVYVPLVHQMTLYAGSLNSPRTWFWVGEQMPLSGTAPGGNSGQGSRSPLAYVRMPDFPADEQPVRDEVFSFTQPGIYAFRNNDQQYYRAANIRPEELELDALNADEFVSRMQAPVREGSSPLQSRPAPGIQKTDLDLGPFVLGLALILLLVELWASGRLSGQRVSG